MVGRGKLVTRWGVRGVALIALGVAACDASPSSEPLAPTTPDALDAPPRFRLPLRNVHDLELDANGRALIVASRVGGPEYGVCAVTADAQPDPTFGEDGCAWFSSVRRQNIAPLDDAILALGSDPP